MMLLMLVALAMLSLSNSSARSVSVGSGISEARANARMALMFAIGELQEQTGPDQRISANGAIVSQVDVLHPHWTGVWSAPPPPGIGYIAPLHFHHALNSGTRNNLPLCGSG
jgi:hypothetical protein